MMTFPVLLTWEDRRAFPDAPNAVPWSLLANHEEWALRNHGQTLLRLAERGGLCPSEMLAVIEHRRWHSMPLDKALADIARAVEALATEPA